MSYTFPPSLVAAEAKLKEIFISEASSLGIIPTEAERLFNLLPDSVKSAPAMKFVLGQEWRYVFGDLFHIKKKPCGFGIPHQAPLVINLVRVISVAERVLKPEQFTGYWWRQFSDPAKHLDAMVEILAVANVAPIHNLGYELLGLGIGSYRIDWLLSTKEDNKFLLEVKNRPGQSAQELERIQSISKSNPGEPITDFNALFKSTFSKFLSVSTSPYTQGVILFLGIKVPADQFASFFYEHLQNNLHFVALGKEDKEFGISVNILATSPEISSRVLSVFGWRNSADLIY